MRSSICTKYQHYPKSMLLRKLAEQNREELSFATLKGIFADYRAKHCSRKQLVEAIHDWQVTAAKEALNGRN